MACSPSPFVADAWFYLLRPYPGPLRFHINSILRWGTLLGYKGPEVLRFCENHRSASRDEEVIDDMIESDLLRSRISEVVSPSFPYCASPLGLVDKDKELGTFRRIHDLSAPHKSSVNDGIDEKNGYLHYTRIGEILRAILTAGRGCTILKRDVADAFRNIPIAPHTRWLMGFGWKGRWYQENCLSFGLRTAPFIFNLFAEAFHWLLQSYLGWLTLFHYLDDFMLIMPRNLATPALLAKLELDYILLTDLLGVPRRDDKNACGTRVVLLGFMVDTVLLQMSIPKEKLEKVSRLTTNTLSETSLSLVDAQSLAGLLTWCAPAVQLGWVFCRRMWSFVASYGPNATAQWRKRISMLVREDLQWWSSLAASPFNGVHFFDENRDTMRVYTDASKVGIGGFAFESTIDVSWHTAQAQGLLSDEFVFSHPIVAIDTVFDINIYEMLAVQVAIQHWGKKWQGKRAIVYTDNTTVFQGFQKQSLASPANASLRETLLFAASIDLEIIAEWVPGKDNDLADALSRFNWEQVANLCQTLGITSSTPIPSGRIKSQKTG